MGRRRRRRGYMATDGTWQRLGGRRISRRRTVLGLAGGSAAAAFLAACGGDSNKESGGAATTASGGGQAASGTQAAKDQPKLGGVISQPLPTDPPSMDLHTVTTYTGVWPVNPVFNQLVQMNPDKSGDTAQDIVADLATKWEQADPTTLIFTLKPGVKF